MALGILSIITGVIMFIALAASDHTFPGAAVGLVLVLTGVGAVKKSSKTPGKPPTGGGGPSAGNP
jgi:hypothetical protein